MEEKATTEISWARRTIMMIVAWCINNSLESASAAMVCTTDGTD
jgi:L-lactate permease